MVNTTWKRIVQSNLTTFSNHKFYNWGRNKESELTSVQIYYYTGGLNRSFTNLQGVHS